MLTLINEIKTNYNLNESELSFFSAIENFVRDTKINTGVVELLIRFKLDLASIIGYLKYSTKIEYQISADAQAITDTLISLETIDYSNMNEDAESLRRMLVGMCKDLRVLIIKLCLILDEISNYKSPISKQEKQLLKQVETIFAPLAERLGLNALKSELEDCCLKFLNPKVYEYLLTNSLLIKEENFNQIEKVKNKVNTFLDELNIQATITSRQKHFSSIHKKMKTKNIPLANIYDLIAMRVLVNSIDECYLVLGKIHSIYKPMPDRVKDYIASPKSNGYQSLHTTIIADNQRPLEIQIRTQEMHRFAEYGVAAHWLYKEKRSKQTELDKKVAWIREIMENSSNLSSNEFIDTLKTNLYLGVIFVQTPKGKILEFPEGSNIIDFAYAIHSDIGNKCVGAKINGKIAPINTKLTNGDIVEIITSSSSKGPSRDWLKTTKTASARSKIHAFFKKELKDENIRIGRNIVDQALKNKNIQPSKVLIKENIESICRKYAFGSEDEMFAAIGYGSIPSHQIVNRLVQDYLKSINVESNLKKENIIIKKNKDGVLIDGDSGMLVRYAGCCQPLPGDDIVGYISRGRGVTIHKADCINVKYLEQERLINALWDTNNQLDFDTTFKICSYKTKTGNDILQIFNENNIKILKFEVSENEDSYITSIVVKLKSKEERNKLFKTLSNTEGIYEVIKGGK